MKEKKWDYVEALKFVVIVIIILNHSIQYKWNVYKVLSNDFQNPLMIFASGIIFSYCIIDLNKYKTFNNLVEKKAKRLLIPLFLTSTLYYLPIMKFANLLVDYESFNRPVYRIIIDYLLGKELDQLWFIYALFIMYVVMYPLVKHTKFLHSICGQVIVFISLCILKLISYKYSTSLFCIRNIMLYLVFFLSGYIVNLHYSFFNKVSKNKLLPIVALFIVLIIYYLDYKTTFMAGMTYSGDTWTAVVMAFLEIVKQFGLIYLITIFIKFIFYNTKIFRIKLISYMVKNSFYMYLFHQPIVKLLLPTLNKCFVIDTDLKNLCCSILITVVAIIVSIIVVEILGRFRYLYSIKSKR